VLIYTTTVLDRGGFGEFGELLHSRPVTGSGPDLRGGGKLGSSPGASTTKGPPQKKTVKNYCLRKHKNTF